MERFGNVQPLDKIGLTHRHNFLLCLAVLRLYRGGPVMCCALTVNRLLITIIIIIVGFQSVPSQISSRRVHFLPSFLKKKIFFFKAHSIVLLLRCIDIEHQNGERVLRVNSKVMFHRPSCFVGKAVTEIKHPHKKDNKANLCFSKVRGQHCTRNHCVYYRVLFIYRWVCNVVC